MNNIVEIGNLKKVHADSLSTNPTNTVEKLINVNNVRPHSEIRPLIKILS